MKRIKWLYTVLATVGLAVAAQAAEPDYRWYVSPSVGAIFSGTGGGAHFSLAAGRDVLPNFGVELELATGSQSVDNLPSGNDYERTIFGVNALAYLTPQGEKIRPYLLANGNFHSIDFLGESLSGAGIGLGGGAFISITKSLDLRLDGRYNLDFVSASGPVAEKTFNVGTGTVGVRYKFGADPDDSDGDGVPNGKDKCPDTPAGTRVDGDGCPLAKVIALNGVTFEFDSTRLRPDALTILDQASGILTKYPDMQVEVAGHTDSKGSEAYNLNLSDGRAASVREYFVSKGVPESQISSKGYGEAEPVADNATDEGRERNRRVELRILN